MTEENDTPDAEAPTVKSAKKTSKPRMIAGVAFLLLGVLLAAQVISQLAKPSLASNEQIQSFYGFTPIENPNFGDDQFLKVNDSNKMIDVCERPSVTDAQNRTELKCETPL